MKKTITLVLTMALTATMAMAQFNYTFSTYQSPYTRLTDDTVVSVGIAWQFQKYSMEIGFPFKLDNSPITEFNFYYANLASKVLAGISSGFHITDAQLVDKGNAGGGPQSPISYVVTGPPGNRIFKLQLSNAGFYEEWVNLGTVNDSMSAQVWYYEDSSIVEIHYGPSKVSFPTAYYSHGGPLVGFIRNVDLNSTSPVYDKIYYLKGNPMSPTVDSVGSTGFSSITAITSLPTSGTVYRFAPKKKSTTGIAATGEGEPVVLQQSNRSIVITTTEQVNYSIISLDGKRTPFAGVVQPGSTTIDCDVLTPGLYVIEIQSPGEHIRKKIAFI